MPTRDRELQEMEDCEPVFIDCLEDGVEVEVDAYLNGFWFDEDTVPIVPNSTIYSSTYTGSFRRRKAGCGRQLFTLLDWWTSLLRKSRRSCGLCVLVVSAECRNCLVVLLGGTAKEPKCHASGTVPVGAKDVDWTALQADLASFGPDYQVDFKAFQGGVVGVRHKCVLSIWGWSSDVVFSTICHVAPASFSMNDAVRVCLRFRSF